MKVFLFAYQGQYAERDEGTGWSHFELREYDPVIGRWTAMDPKRVGFTPYFGMNNNPVNLPDPDGGAPPTDFVNTGTGERRHVEDGSSNVVSIEPENWNEFLRAFDATSLLSSSRQIQRTELLSKYGSMTYLADEMIRIRQMHENSNNYEWGLREFSEGDYAFANPDRSKDRTDSQVDYVWILSANDERQKGFIHFHYSSMYEESPSTGVGKDTDVHRGEGVYNVEISKNRIWFYNRYKAKRDPFTGMIRWEKWGTDFSVPYDNNIRK